MSKVPVKQPQRGVTHPGNAPYRTLSATFVRCTARTPNIKWDTGEVHHVEVWQWRYWPRHEIAHLCGKQSVLLNALYLMFQRKTKIIQRIEPYFVAESGYRPDRRLSTQQRSQREAPHRHQGRLKFKFLIPEEYGSNGDIGPGDRKLFIELHRLRPDHIQAPFALRTQLDLLNKEVFQLDRNLDLLPADKYARISVTYQTPDNQASGTPVFSMRGVIPTVIRFCSVVDPSEYHSHSIHEASRINAADDGRWDSMSS
ncbi:hypothetical protein F5I97DRAFT_1830255 [Phlebopus sp. FC_14]|nr:hypothetical protein F5I97DRAFT_1830255 [Phlebopus sp. FC_14]